MIRIGSRRRTRYNGRKIGYRKGRQSGWWTIWWIIRGKWGRVIMHLMFTLYSLFLFSLDHTNFICFVRLIFLPLWEEIHIIGDSFLSIYSVLVMIALPAMRELLLYSFPVSERWCMISVRQDSPSLAIYAKIFDSPSKSIITMEVSSHNLLPENYRDIYVDLKLLGLDRYRVIYVRLSNF